MDVPRGRRTLWVRPAEAQDLAELAELVEADRLPGLPAPSRRIEAAVSGAAGHTVLVARDGSGRLLGATGLRRGVGQDGTGGSIAWLHCREHPSAVAVLLRVALERLPPSALNAFDEPGPLSPYLPGLPVNDRPVTYQALHDAGFRTRHQWLCLQRPARFDERTPEEAPAVHAPRAHHVPAAAGTRAGTGPARRPQRTDLRAAPVGPAAGGPPDDPTGGMALVDLLSPGASRRCHRLQQAGYEEVDLFHSLTRP
ncbi:hypothetical protein [Kitasatospora camelliae]|uniref:N-acetyltransferase domain-containing protein n=1 Tax=Kitasatospora camelliae TaxID=3156397 RepID=A0AAU8JQZ9_9ACTN